MRTTMMHGKTKKIWKWLMLKTSSYHGGLNSNESG